ncbi:hypothetical protein QJQ45_030463 [Haematococcus lacustris]|nr:hypothetical protein QJQ45_030463 [Haematococcus lacustris]
MKGKGAHELGARDELGWMGPVTPQGQALKDKLKERANRWNDNIKLELQHLAAATPAGTSLVAIQHHLAVTLATWDAVWGEYLHSKARTPILLNNNIFNVHAQIHACGAACVNHTVPSQEVNSGIHSSCHHSAAKPMGRLVACVPNEDPERLKRVLDAKHRTIGIDTDALAQQANERRERERQEKERDAAFAQLSNYWADQLSIQQQAADKLRREVASELDSFRETNQLKFTRKEWDINRPDHKKIDEPARVGDDDPRLGTSSMQRFEGEDLSAGDRKKAQNEQAKQWWEEQAAHKAALKAAQQEAEQAYAELARYQDMLQLQAKADEAAIRREMSTTTTEINKRMAEEKRLKALQEKAANLAANLAEIDATLNSPFMTEDPNLAASAMSAYRVRKDHYKGMSEAEKQAILATQLAQMEEKKARDAAREAEDAQYARNQNGILRAMDAQAARVDDFKRQQLAKAADVLRKQTEEKTARDKALSELYANKIAPEFFQQFGTSHR